MKFKVDWNTIVKTAAWTTVTFMIVCGLIKVFWEVHPPFLDEWAIIYNVKFKTPAELWEGLDKVQQSAEAKFGNVASLADKRDFVL